MTNELQRATTVTVLSRALQRELLMWAHEESPREACGILLGKADAEQVLVRVLVKTRNLVRGTDAFEIDPSDVVRADVDARRRGLSLVGFWHSHPRAPAIPSASDARTAWPGHVCVIVSLCAEPAVRMWSFSDGRFFELSLGPSKEV